MGKIVAKFGGSSLSDAGQFVKVRQIIEMDTRRCYVVPSAPGKRFDGDEKVTDLLYGLESAIEQGEDYRPFYDKIFARFTDIKRDLGLSVNIEARLEEILANLLDGAGADYAASRGEYLNGMLIADYLGYAFVDAAEVILFDKRGKYDGKRTEKVLSERLRGLERYASWHAAHGGENPCIWLLGRTSRHLRGADLPLLNAVGSMM